MNNMKRLCLILILLGGCATEAPRPYYKTHPQAGPLATALYTCYREAQAFKLRLDNAIPENKTGHFDVAIDMAPIVNQRKADKLYESCMQASGWSNK